MAPPHHNHNGGFPMGNGNGKQQMDHNAAKLYNMMQQGQQGKEGGKGKGKAPQGGGDYYQQNQQAPRAAAGSPNPRANVFVPGGGYQQPYQHQTQQPRREAPNQPSLAFQTQVHYGDPTIVNHPGFAAAAAGPAHFESFKMTEEEEESLNAAYADAEAWTDESMARVRIEWLEKKAAKGRAHLEKLRQQAQQAAASVRLDLQKSGDKIITGRSVYVVRAVIQHGSDHGGDPGRMSNGIYLVHHPNGKELVAKFLNVCNDVRQERARAERDVLKTLSVMRSPNINFLHDSHWPNGSDNCILILQYCDGNTVEYWIQEKQKMNKLFNEQFLWHCIYHLCCALSLCHHGLIDPLKRHLQPKKWNAICHLDIKPGNIFFDMKRPNGLENDEFPTIVLADFGCAVTSEDILHKKFPKVGQPFGTTAWYPPEGLQGYVGKYAGRYGKSTDIWQLGAVIASMARLTMLPPRAYLATAQPCGPAYSEALNKMVSYMLVDDLEKRPSAIDIVEKMKAWGRIPEDEGAQVSRERAAAGGA